MKRNTMKIASLCLIVLLLSALLPAAVAEGKPELPAQTFWAGERSWCLGMYNIPDNAKLVSIKSSNPKVLQVSDGGDLDMLFFDPIKPGKSKVTVTYNVKGKNASVSRTYTVKKFPSVFSTLKFNGKTIKPMQQLKNIYEVSNFKGTSATLTFKPKSGWSIRYAELDVEGQKRVNIKSGKAFNIPKGKSGYIVIDAVEKKSNADLIFFIEIYR